MKNLYLIVYTKAARIQRLDKNTTAWSTRRDGTGSIRGIKMHRASHFVRPTVDVCYLLSIRPQTCQPHKLTEAWGFTSDRARKSVQPAPSVLQNIVGKTSHWTVKVKGVLWYYRRSWLVAFRNKLSSSYWRRHFFTLILDTYLSVILSTNPKLRQVSLLLEFITCFNIQY